MTYTTLAQLSSLTDKEVVEAVPALIDFVKDPETKVSQNNGKPYTEQSLKLKGSDGTECWATIYEPKLFMDRSAKGRKAVFCSTVRDGKMQGVQVGIWNGKVSLRISGSANITFPESHGVDSQLASIQKVNDVIAAVNVAGQVAGFTAPTRMTKQLLSQSAPVDGLVRQSLPISTPQQIKDLWAEYYYFALPICGESGAVAATATMFIESNKRNIGPTLTQPHAAIAALAPSARKIADEVIAKGGYDADKLPDGDELDAVVDLLIDKAAESISRERLGVAYDAFVAGYRGSKDDAVKAMVSSWEVFIGGVK